MRSEKPAIHQHNRTEKLTQTTFPKQMMCSFIRKKKVNRNFPLLREKN